MESYGTASGILARVEQRRGSARNLCLSSQVRQKRVVFKLVHETLKHQKLLDSLLTKHTSWQDAVAASGQPSLARAAYRVCAYDLLLGQGLRRRSGQCMRDVRSAMVAVLKHKAVLKQGFADLGPGGLPSSPPSRPLPRYARVNELKASLEVVEQVLRSSGVPWSRDAHVPTLLSAPAGTELHDHPLVTSGQLILQEKASCLPVVALRPERGWRVVDACAAPGNKTSQLAAAVGHGGVVLAWERDARRAELLRRRVSEAGASAIVDVREADFLRADHAALGRVDAVLVDPSCSGSGIVTRAGPAAEDADPKEVNRRLARLAHMQARLLAHALGFPAARAAVYSTCSVHHVENEGVVAEVLARCGHLGWRLADAVPGWHRRGEAKKGVALSEADCAKCVRCLPEDGTNGFFVARFERCAAGASAGGCAAVSDADGGPASSGQYQQGAELGGTGPHRGTSTGNAVGLPRGSLSFPARRGARARRWPPDHLPFERLRLRGVLTRTRARLRQRPQY